MLTESEREWAIKKSKWIKRDICYLPDYPTKDELFDALEFSERVAVKLAKHIHDKPLVCETNWDCPYWPQGTCAWCYLKAARIEVEEEMDANGT